MHGDTAPRQYRHRRPGGGHRRPQRYRRQAAGHAAPNANATVTICHSRTKDLPAVCRRGDILVAAIGRPGFITTEFVKPGATILDVGINHITDPVLFERFFKGDEKREKQFTEKGSTIIGDCDPSVTRMAGACTPVPGGVGKLTIAMLMSNTVKAARLRRGAKLPNPKPPSKADRPPAGAPSARPADRS